MGPKPAEMVKGVNSELRTMIRDLALRRESHDRRNLYWTLLQAQIWTPVRVESAPGHVQPGDLHPLNCEALDGMASYCIFTHDQAAAGWQACSSDTQGLRLERIHFVPLLPLLLDAGAGSLYINPEAKFSGELYRHELETCMEGARKLAAKPVQRVIDPDEALTPASASGLWDRLRAWLP